MAPRVTSREIVGRGDARASVEDVLEQAAAGRPRICLVAGEAGIGKTRLVGELEDRARNAGFLVLHGEAVELAGDELPYAPLIAALRDVPDDDALALLMPDGAPAPSRFAPGRLYEGVLQQLDRLAEDAPVLLVLEDLHWADRSTRGLLAFLARNLREQRLAIAITYRTGELPDDHPLRRLIPELTRRQTVLRVDLAPLSAADVGRQVEAITGRVVPAARAERLHARAGGNPFFVEELVAGGGAEADEVPDTLADAILLRVARLEPAARAALDLVAAAGGRADHAMLERLTDTPELHAALDVQILVRERDDRGVAFRHGLIGEVLYARLLPQERAELHRSIATALAEAPDAPAAQLAEHWHRAGEPAAALRASVAAGLEASRVSAFAEARRHFERALELWDAVTPADGSLPLDHVALAARAAQAARFAGDAQAAIAHCEAALALLDHAAEPLRAAQLYERLGEYHFWDDTTALGHYRRALELLPDDAGPERARLLAAEGHALMGLRRWAESRECCEAALAAAREAGAAEVEIDAQSTLALVLVFLGEVDAGERHFREALAAAGAPTAGESAMRAHLQLGELRRLRGDHAGALDVMDRGEAVAARVGMRSSFGNFMHANGADDLLRLGRWEEVAARLDEERRRDLGTTTAFMHHLVAGRLHALRGEPAAARTELARADELLAGGLSGEFGTPLAAAWAELALIDGDAEAAAGRVEAALAAAGDDKDPLYTPVLYALGVRAEAERAERARGLRREPDVEASVERGRRLAAELEQLLARWGGGAAAPDAHANHRLVRAELGRLEGVDAPAPWQVAAEAWEPLAEPHPAAYARIRLAEAILLTGGERAAAGRELATAHATAARLGAVPLLEQAQTLARRARLSLDAPAPAPASDGAAARLGLTAREAEVLALLAEGLTNREIATRLFISQKTVASHLAHIFDKLDVHSRVEAAGRAHQLQLVQGVAASTPDG